MCEPLPTEVSETRRSEETGDHKPQERVRRGTVEAEREMTEMGIRHVTCKEAVQETTVETAEVKMEES